MIRREQKEELIKELAENLGKCQVAIATDYRGITAKEMVLLRRHLHEQGVDYQVIKNTLARFAAEKAGKKGLEEFLTGPLALAISYDDVIKPAKILSDHIRTATSVLKIKGGILGDRVLTAADIASLAATPSREVLLAQLIGRMKSPIYSLHFVLSAPLRGLVGALQARARQMEGA
ncbi:MAG: 50S ribosomal protein L10 [Dehalococcoidia bacterium]|nr:50S ribosomal protein L10 [Dehalococcoidia bacterium]MDD5494694.1 50S ribosomal protein L10 [Dehalococcoidia bacterium]